MNSTPPRVMPSPNPVTLPDGQTDCGNVKGQTSGEMTFGRLDRKARRLPLKATPPPANTSMRSRARTLSSGHWERVTCQHGGSLPLEKRNFSLYFGFLWGKKAYNFLSVHEMTKVDCLKSSTNLWDLISSILCSKASWQNANLSILQLQA